ncbi:MAG: hypothetical protein ACREXP_21255, partial [Steroidobacteraceae bacterium]
ECTPHSNARSRPAINNHLIGALLIAIPGIVTAEAARPLRFLNVLLGLWLLGSPGYRQMSHAEKAGTQSQPV